MDLRGNSGTWYEVVMVRGRGCKLAERYFNQREAKKAIKEANEKAVKNRYKTDEYFILLCSSTCLTDENGDIVSETITKIRIA